MSRHKLLPLDVLCVSKSYSADCRNVIESLCEHGYDDEKPVEVEMHSNDVYFVFNGRRCVLALGYLRDNRPDDYERVLANHPGMVPVKISAVAFFEDS
jgi:hypothetical protein